MQDIDLRLLEHVGGVDASLEPAVEPNLDHPAQAVAMAVEELRQLNLAGPGAACQPSRFARIRHHVVSPSHLNCAKARRIHRFFWPGGNSCNNRRSGSTNGSGHALRDWWPVDQQARFLDLLEANHGRWQGIARAYAGQDAEDLFQEIALQVWRRCPRFATSRP